MIAENVITENITLIPSTIPINTNNQHEQSTSQQTYHVSTYSTLTNALTLGITITDYRPSATTYNTYTMTQPNSCTVISTYSSLEGTLG